MLHKMYRNMFLPNGCMARAMLLWLEGRLWLDPCLGGMLSHPTDATLLLLLIVVADMPVPDFWKKNTIIKLLMGTWFLSDWEDLGCSLKSRPMASKATLSGVYELNYIRNLPIAFQWWKYHEKICKSSPIVCESPNTFQDCMGTTAHVLQIIWLDDCNASNLVLWH